MPAAPHGPIHCPACRKRMVVVPVGAIQIDVCKLGCKGIWFDARELPVVDAAHKGFDDVLAEALAAPLRIRPGQPIPCPRCRRPLHRQAYRYTGVMVDTCYLCGGFFLEAGELKQIRELTDSDRVRQYEQAKRQLLAYKPPRKNRHAWGCQPMVTRTSSSDSLNWFFLS